MRGAAATLGLGLALFVTPLHAAPAAYDIAFVSEFADACVPGRLGYQSTIDAATGAGWTAVDKSANAELALIMTLSEGAAARTASESDVDIGNPLFSYRTFAKPIVGVTHYLVVSRAEADSAVGHGSRWAMVGCYLYNFDAAQAIDPEAVTALIGNPIAQSQVDMHIASWAWGPPPAMPRTLDTYLTFIPEVSQYKDQTGFAGLVLKFDTSEPDANESQS